MPTPQKTYNELGYPIINNNLHKKLFYGSGGRPSISEHQLERAKIFLKDFGIQVPVDSPSNLYNGDLPFPKLQGSTIVEHFENIAKETVGKYVEAADDFSADQKIAPLPPISVIELKPGWTQYKQNKDNTWSVRGVKYPAEAAYIFDTETFVEKGAFPVIGTAIGKKAVYLWLSEEMVYPDLPEGDWTGPDLIPLGSGSLVIGHNISYDRARAQVDYNLNTKITNFYFDTMAAHIAVSGLASEQRWLHSLSKKSKHLLTEHEKRLLKYKPRWFKAGSTNSLVEAYNFHVASASKINNEWGLIDDTNACEPFLTEQDKTIRDIFVKATSINQLARRFDLIDYAIKDVYYTAKLFQAVWPKYKQATPSYVGLASQYYLNSSKIPLTKKWNEWLEEVEARFHEHNVEASNILVGLIKQYVSEWQTYLQKDIDAFTKPIPEFHKICKNHGINPRTKGGKDRPTDWLLNQLVKKGVTEWQQRSREFASQDPWLSQLDWTPKSFHGKYKCLPWWASNYLTKSDLLSTKTPCAGLLLKLEWEGHPVLYSREHGYGYIDENGLKQKVPHPKGNDENVGSLLSKDFIVDMEVGRLSSNLPEAKKALDIANATSYWISIKKRVLGRLVKPLVSAKSKGSQEVEGYMTLPQIVAHGTVTRRTVESMMVTMCSTKSYRIGTELKTRIQCPEGWKVVGADFDGQELQIASIYADCWDYHNTLRTRSSNSKDDKNKTCIGASPLSYTVLAGSKAKGTDAHTALATAMGVTRDVAKIVNFTVLYGGGAKTIASSIKKFYKDKNAKELYLSATKAIDYKKGRRTRQGFYQGGADSGCFNYMETLANGNRGTGEPTLNGIPCLPVLGTQISTALRPSIVNKDFHTGRVNWTIQAAGSEILAIYLTAIHWLAKEFSIPLQFIISIHDEIWFMVKQEYAKSFAVVMQMAHLATWARFHKGCGIDDVPLARAYFSDVAIDNRLRKSPDELTETISNASGGKEPKGEAFTMQEMFLKGWVKNLPVIKS